MTTQEPQTETIDEPAYLADPRVLAYLAGTDADLDRLVLEEDGQLWAYSKRNPRALCAQRMLDLVVVAFPRYAQASEPLTATWTNIDAEDRSNFRLDRSHPSATLPLPKTGEARGLLASQTNGGNRRPWLEINGEQRPCPKPTVDGEAMRVAVVDDGRLTAYAMLSTRAFKLLASSVLRPDTLMFRMLDGDVTTRVRPAKQDHYVLPVNSLLAELGSKARVSVSALA